MTVIATAASTGAPAAWGAPPPEARGRFWAKLARPMYVSPGDLVLSTSHFARPWRSPAKAKALQLQVPTRKVVGLDEVADLGGVGEVPDVRGLVLQDLGRVVAVGLLIRDRELEG